MNQGSMGTGLKQFYGGGNNGGYDNIDKIRVDNVTRIGTSYLPKVKEQNSDVLLIVQRVIDVTF